MASRKFYVDIDTSGKVIIGDIQEKGSAITTFLTDTSGEVQYRGVEDVLADIDVNPIQDVDATNISNVVFSLRNGETIETSFSHYHTQYALSNHGYRHESGGDDEIDIDGGSYI